MSSPIFRSYDDINADDLAVFPVWALCHITDGDMPWYNDIDEETCRGINAGFPLQESFVSIVAAKYETAAGVLLNGFIENWGNSSAHPLLRYLPTIFDDESNRIQLWHGNTFQFGNNNLDHAIEKLGKIVDGDLEAHFPIGFTVDNYIFGKPFTGQFEGFGSFIAEDRIGIHDVG